MSYGRNYIAKKLVWVVAIPIRHADGYISDAVKGEKKLLNGKVYLVIGAVSASHTIIGLGTNKEFEVGDVSILKGPDHTEIHLNQISDVTSTSVYDILMHLSSRLPKNIV